MVASAVISILESVSPPTVRGHSESSDMNSHSFFPFIEGVMWDKRTNPAAPAVLYVSQVGNELCP